MCRNDRRQKFIRQCRSPKKGHADGLDRFGPMQRVDRNNVRVCNFDSSEASKGDVVVIFNTTSRSSRLSWRATKTTAEPFPSQLLDQLKIAELITYGWKQTTESTSRCNSVPNLPMPLVPPGPWPCLRTRPQRRASAKCRSEILEHPIV